MPGLFFLRVTDIGRDEHNTARMKRARHCCFACTKSKEESIWVVTESSPGSLSE